MAFAHRPNRDWQLRTRALPLDRRTLLMGILNVTPDSFSDGGAYLAETDAVARAIVLLTEGADILDIGGESTRPGAVAVNPAAEQARILPVIRAILRVRPDTILSVDTYRAETARMAVEAGAEMINDVSGLLWDGEMAGVMAQSGAGVVLMHTRGNPREWATQPPLASGDVLPTVMEGLAASLRTAHAAGIESRRIVLDPGFGFGKRGEENFVLHADLARLQELGFPVLVGTSRKGFLGPRDAPAEARLSASMASNVAAILAGAAIIRTHDVLTARSASDVADAILRASPSP